MGKVSFEPKTRLTCWIHLIDVWKGELAFPVVIEAFNLILPKFATLTTLYEILWESLHVYHDDCQSWIDLQRRKQCSGIGNLFSRCFRMINWPEATGGTSKCGDNVLFILMWIFAILSTLYGDPEAYTCMTLWMESSPCVSIGHMFKERAFWNFLCIISWHMLTFVIGVRADQVPGDLARFSGTWILSLVLWMPCKC